mmetsp:Transcript_25361/g.47656  ORF Transcript_25361/g.47656 Transcript_25361/m.47656 type:complete len:472 (-) Transcript_25361:44-1459(-)
MSVTHGAGEMYTAASRQVGILPSRGLMVDSFGERKLSSESSSDYSPVDGLVRRQELAAQYNSNWIDESLDARSRRFTKLTGKASTLNTTIPSVLDHDEHWVWDNVDDEPSHGKVSYLRGDFSPSIYDLVFQYLKLHQRDLHLLCYDNHIWRNSKGNWATKFQEVGLNLVNGEIRVVNGLRGFGIAKREAEQEIGTASTLQSVSVKGDEALEDFLNGFNNRCSPLRLGHELKVDERLLTTVREEKAVLRKEKEDKEAKRQSEFKRKMKKMEGKRKVSKSKNKVSPEKGYVGNLTGVVKLSRPQTRTYDNEISWKVRNDYLIKKPNFVSPNHPTRSNWLREGNGEDEVKRIVDERRIESLVERKGALSLQEEENALQAVKREKTFRMSRLRNGFQGGDIEKQGFAARGGRRSSTVSWGDHEGGVGGGRRYENTSNFNVQFTPKYAPKPVGPKGRALSVEATPTGKTQVSAFFS